MTLGAITSFVKKLSFTPFRLRGASGESRRVESPESILSAEKLGLAVVQEPLELMTADSEGNPTSVFGSSSPPDPTP